MDRISTKGSMIDQIDLSRVPRSGFDRSFHNFLSCKLGKIVPTRVEEVLPGDRIKGSSHIVANFEPLVAPILGNMVLKQETFYVPQSILWKNAHNFFTGKKGFNNAIPSLSLKDIVADLDDAAFGGSSLMMFDDLGLDLFNANYSDYNDLASSPYNISGFRTNIIPMFGTYKTYLATRIKQFGTDNYVLDLVTPLLDIINEFQVVSISPVIGEPAYIGDPSYNIAEMKAYVNAWLTKLWNFWLGPSSLCDYMGIGVYNMDYIIRVHMMNLSSVHAEDEDAPVYYDFSDRFSSIPLNWIPFRANYSVWYWNYRDQLLEPDVLDAEEFMETDNLMSNEIPLLLLLRVRCWFKDTFTTALTNTGNGNILIPTLSSAISFQHEDTISSYMIDHDLSNTSDAESAHLSGADLVSITIGGIEYSIPSNYIIHNEDLQTSDVSAEPYYLSLDMLDRAKRLSTWVSKRLILGVEYDDVLYSSFMVKLSNVRMRVPELLDAGRSTVSLNTIVNNTTIPDAQVAGDKSAVAWAENSSNGVNYYAEEHGYLISYFTVLPIQSYAGGIQRMYLRQNRFDFAWPEFAQMGFDAIYNCELATPQSGEATMDNAAIAVFGYQGRYYDYKSKLDEEHGRMRTDLNYMTFSRDFSLALDAPNNPKLNYMFVHCWPPTDMFVVDDKNEDVVKSVDISHNYAWERVLPVPSETIR